MQPIALLVTNGSIFCGICGGGLNGSVLSGVIGGGAVFGYQDPNLMRTCWPIVVNG